VLAQRRSWYNAALTVVFLRRCPTFGVGLAAHGVIIFALINTHWRAHAGCHPLGRSTGRGSCLTFRRHVGCARLRTALSLARMMRTSCDHHVPSDLVRREYRC